MGAHWKREKVQDHKFDFINVDDFVDNSFWRQFRYMLVFAAIIRGILVYCSDIFTAVNLLANQNTNSFVGQGGFGITDLNIKLPYDVYKYLFSVCILFSFLLLALEIRRASGIVKSRDISYAFTSQIASRYYTVRSYPHYCLFAQINNSKKMVDEIAFFCFFTFRNWKRLILADAPRQVINATILYQTFRTHKFNFDKNGVFDWDSVIGVGNSFLMKKISLGAMMFTVAMFALSLLSLICAVILYIPLVSHIQGNLKEFCCHKIDKRIDELIKKNTKNRATAALKAAKGGKGGKGGKDIPMDTLKQPTLPQLDMLEAPPPLPATTPRNVYNQASTPSPYSPRNGNAGYGQQQEYGYGNGSYNNPSPQQQGYTANYTADDYFQAKPPARSKQPDGASDPYAESAFTTDDIYDSYGGNQDQQHLQQKPGRDMYGDYYNNNDIPSAPQRRYDEYSHQRTASPLPSQHGSDLDNGSNGNSGHTYPAGPGTNGYNNGYSNGGGQYNNNNGGYGGRQGYGNDYYPSSGQTAGNGSYSPQLAPQRPRRQDTAQTNNRPYRNGGNGGY
ncbi:hypothetical protein EDD21DRAFT_379318 [Dissophora ornata]|nr:hypothetical protein BGZ58_005810 [Dissophora ornata]KAI8599624.1 hypothetical protein EDD21DRAFT_379318 [Dissophora ornata]